MLEKICIFYNFTLNNLTTNHFIMKIELEHSQSSKHARRKQLDGESTAWDGGCLMVVGLILGVGLIILLVWKAEMEIVTAAIIGGIVAAIFIIIGVVKKLKGWGEQGEGETEEWIEEGGTRRRY
jgi:hypothetical protein